MLGGLTFNRCYTNVASIVNRLFSFKEVINDGSNSIRRQGEIDHWNHIDVNVCAKAKASISNNKVTVPLLESRCHLYRLLLVSTCVRVCVSPRARP